MGRIHGTNMIRQKEKIFFDKNDVLSEDQIDNFRKIVNPDCQESPFNKFVGNRKAISKLSVVAFNALQRYNHVCSDINFSLTGPASSGKTTLVKLFADIIEVPLIEISPKGVGSLDDILQQVAITLEKEEVSLEEVEENFYVLPPCIVFIDEVHALKNSLVQGLLKATEPKDCHLITESGLRVNCFNVCWIIATTDIGKVFDAFQSRFSTVELKYLSKKEVAKIVKLNYPELDDDVCDLVAHYNPKIARKALEFAKYVVLYGNMHKNNSWEDICREVAENEGIDEYGMSESAVKLLKSLYDQGTIPLKRLPYFLNKKVEEIESFVLPALVETTDEQPAMVMITPRGVRLTDEGCQELVKRNLVESCQDLSDVDEEYFQNIE